jgi:putative colanic acid biosynthesis UDP-glucose lipid carrier transferase
MLIDRSIGIRTLGLFCQTVLVTVSLWGWLFLSENGVIKDRALLERILLYNEFLLVGVLFGAGRNHDASGPHREWVLANRRSSRQAIGGLACVLLVLVTLKDELISPLFFISFLPCFYVTLLFSNYLLPRTLGRWSFSGDRQERVALAGTIEQASRLKPWLERKNLLGLRTVGIVCPGPVTPLAAPFPVLGTLDQISEILHKRAITQLIVLDLSLGSEWLQRLTLMTEEAAVRLLALHDFNDYFNHPTITFEDDGVRFISLRDEPLENPVNRVFKRLLDLMVAIPVVLLVLPVVAGMVWLFQCTQSRGPLFLGQIRTGMRNRPFKMYKFRTMHVTLQDAAQQAVKDDPRVYPAGRWMRKLSLDELPQFVNVLLGDMSVVGPRPHLQEHDEMFARVMRKYLVRRFIRPGITGWAQVNGYRGEVHSEKDIQRRVEADIHYLENWSFSLDCLIILKTFKQIFRPLPTAY